MHVLFVEILYSCKNTLQLGQNEFAWGNVSFNDVYLFSINMLVF